MEHSYSEQIGAIQAAQQILHELVTHNGVLVSWRAEREAELDLINTRLSAAGNTVYGAQLDGAPMQPESNGDILDKSIFLEKYEGSKTNPLKVDEIGLMPKNIGGDLRPKVVAQVERKRLPILHIEGYKLRADLVHDHRKLYNLLLDISRKTSVKLSQPVKYKKSFRYRLEIDTDLMHDSNTFEELYDWAKDINDISEKK